MESELRRAALDQIRITSYFASHLKLCNHVTQTYVIGPYVIKSKLMLLCISPHNKNFFQWSNEFLDLTLKLKSEHTEIFSSFPHFLLNLFSQSWRGLVRESKWSQSSASPRPTKWWVGRLHKHTKAPNKYSQHPRTTCGCVCSLSVMYQFPHFQT